ncbi:MAG: hypothetical protein IIW99_03495 [Treponema sp.]|nr:hypothetical protein [Treponema sp.]
MKKLGVVLASALAAGLFFGCSNDSDDNNMGLLLAVANGGSSSITANLPENVGTNELAGKSFNNGNYSISFDNTFVTLTKTKLNFADKNGSNPFAETIIRTSRYSYNAETKNLYYNNLNYNDPNSSGKIYTNSAEERLVEPSMTFSTEEEYSAKHEDFYKKLYKFIGYERTDEELKQDINKELKSIRAIVYMLSSQCNLPPAYTAYKDEDCETALTPDQVSLYNKYMTMQKNANERTIECHAYKLEGGNLKLANSGNLPAGIKFGGIYNGTYDFSASINNIVSPEININVFEIIDPNNSLGFKHFTPSINLNGILKVTSASDDSVTCIVQLPNSTTQETTLILENKTTADKTTVTVKIPLITPQGEVVDYVEYGTFDIPYKTNIPDSSYTTYTRA